jgi:hypothetical protein
MAGFQQQNAIPKNALYIESRISKIMTFPQHFWNENRSMVQNDGSALPSCNGNGQGIRRLHYRPLLAKANI